MRFMAERYVRLLVMAVLLAAAGLPSRSSAQVPRPAPLGSEPGPAPDLAGVQITEKPGAQVPLELTFTDETGRTVTLAEYFNKGRPVVLQLGYYECPMLCGLVSQGLVATLRQLNLRAGTDFDVLSVTINPSESYQLAGLKKQTYVKEYGRPEQASGFHFLTGTAANSRQLADAVGFGFKWMEKEQQYSHPAALMILSPEGKVSRYLYGARFDPRTMRLSLVEAAEGKVGSTMDKVMLVCFQYDATTGKYTPAAMMLLQIAATTTILALGGFIAWMLWRERHRNSGSMPAGATGS